MKSKTAYNGKELQHQEFSDGSVFHLYAGVPKAVQYWLGSMGEMAKFHNGSDGDNNRGNISRSICASCIFYLSTYCSWDFR
jgi:hypothetical protein